VIFGSDGGGRGRGLTCLSLTVVSGSTVQNRCNGEKEDTIQRFKAQLQRNKKRPGKPGHSRHTTSVGNERADTEEEKKAWQTLQLKQKTPSLDDSTRPDGQAHPTEDLQKKKQIVIYLCNSTKGRKHLQKAPKEKTGKKGKTMTRIRRKRP